MTQPAPLNPELLAAANRLRRRYRRFFCVDLVIHVLYGLTACLPLWAMMYFRREIPFHSFGVLAILAVSILGVLANLRLLRGHRGGFMLGLSATLVFLVTRAAMLWWGAAIVARRFDGHAWEMIEGLIAPIVIILLVLVFYRMLYHISAYCHTRMFLHRELPQG